MQVEARLDQSGAARFSDRDAKPASVLQTLFVAALPAAILAALASLQLFASFGQVVGLELLAFTAVVWSGTRRAAAARLAATSSAAAAAGYGLLFPMSAVNAAVGPEQGGFVLVAAVLTGAVAIVVVVGSGSGRGELEQRQSSIDSHVNHRSRIVRMLAAVPAAAALTLSVGAGTMVAMPLGSAFALGLLGETVGLYLLAAGLLARPYLDLVLNLEHGLRVNGAAVLVGAAVTALLQGSAAVIFSRGFFRRLLALRAVPRPNRAAAARPVIQAVTYGVVVAPFLVAIEGLDEVGLSALLGSALLLGTLTVAAQALVSGIAARISWIPLAGLATAALLIAARCGVGVTMSVSLAALVTGATAVFWGGSAGVALRSGSARDLSRSATAGALMVGLLVAGLVVAAFGGQYARLQVTPPPVAALLFVADVAARPPSDLWAPGWIALGAVTQLIFGGKRHAGLMLGIGLIVDAPLAAWVVCGGLATRVLLYRTLRARAASVVAAVAIGAVIGELLGMLGRG